MERTDSEYFGGRRWGPNRPTAVDSGGLRRVEAPGGVVAAPRAAATRAPLSRPRRVGGVSRGELFGSLLAMVFLVNFVRVVFAPLVQPVAAEFGVAAASLGLVTSAAWLGSAAPRLPTGVLLTRVARHRVIAITGALLVVTATATALSSTVPELAVGAFLMGLSSGMYFVAANPLVSELYPERVARVMGIHGMARQVAAVAAPLVVAGILLVADWRTTFFGVAAAAALTTALLLYAARWTKLPQAGARDRSLLTAGRSQWRIVATGVVFIGGVGFLWNGFFNLYGDYLTVAKGVDPATGRLLLSLMFAAGVPAFLVAGRLGERFPNVPLVVTFVVGFVASVVALTFVGGLVAVAVVSLVASFCFYAITPILDTYLLASLPDEHRGSAYAIYSSVMMIVTALGSAVVGGAVAGGFAYASTFRAIAAVVGATAVVMFALDRLGRLPSGGSVA